MDAFTQTLQSWHTFYFMTGGAAAGLIGLMFVALSIGIPLIQRTEMTDEIRRERTAFVTPSILYFTSVLLLDAIMTAPTYIPSGLALILLLGGVLGLAWTMRYIRPLIQSALQRRDFNVWDWLSQILMPLLGFGAILLAAYGFATDPFAYAFRSIWAAVILLLTSAIANTWSLMIWLIDAY